MAVTASGIFVPTIRDALGSEQIGLDLDAETHKVALFTNSITPNFTTDTAYGLSPYEANEVTGTNWPAGGVALTGATFTAISGGVKFDAADVSTATVTVSDARCALIYAAGLDDEAIVLLDFGEDVEATAGTLDIIWHTSGIFTITLA